jgi:hypothetical protein
MPTIDARMAFRQSNWSFDPISRAAVGASGADPAATRPRDTARELAALLEAEFDGSPIR